MDKIAPLVVVIGFGVIMSSNPALIGVIIGVFAIGSVVTSLATK